MQGDFSMRRKYKDSNRVLFRHFGNVNISHDASLAIATGRHFIMNGLAIDTAGLKRGEHVSKGMQRG